MVGRGLSGHSLILRQNCAPNCLGGVSKPSLFGTLFIIEKKLNGIGAFLLSYSLFERFPESAADGGIAMVKERQH